jgi:hypothetical protein
MTRRALVLTDETARHPFLQSLPPHVRRIDPEPDAPPQAPPAWRLTAVDLRQFLMAYCATFIAVTVFIL